jgi:hypothetical protein
MDEGMESNQTESHSATLTKQEKYAILLTLGIGGAVAVIICLVALGMLVGFKLYKYFVHRLAMYQVLAALFFALMCVLELINLHYELVPCLVSAFLLEYSIIVKLMFILCLTFHLFFYSIFHINFKKLEVVHILISVFVPFLFVWVPFVNRAYGQAGAWCWIMNWRNDTADHKFIAGEIEQYTLLYGPAILSLSIAIIAVIAILVVLAYRAFRKQPIPDVHTSLLEKDKHKQALKEVIPLVMYPILSFLLYIPAFINRLVGSIYNNPSLVSFIWSGLSVPALSSFAGLTLIIHIFILKCSSLKRTFRVKHKPTYTTKKLVSNVFCTDHGGIPTTTAATEWEPPPESDVDNNYYSIS